MIIMLVNGMPRMYGDPAMTETFSSELLEQPGCRGISLDGDLLAIITSNARVEYLLDAEEDPTDYRRGVLQRWQDRVEITRLDSNTKEFVDGLIRYQRAAGSRIRYECAEHGVYWASTAPEGDATAEAARVAHLRAHRSPMAYLGFGRYRMLDGTIISKAGNLT